MEWMDQIADLSLDFGEVHLWRIDLAKFRTRASEFHCGLSEGEKARAARFVRVTDQENYIVVRAILRQLLSEYLRLILPAVEFEYSEFEKPSVPNVFNKQDIRFNLSHSGDLCVIGLRRAGEIGVDIEKIREDLDVEGLAKRYFSRQEILELEGLPDDQRKLAFFLCWTRKEAYVKAIGDGLQRPLDQFSITLTPGGTPRLSSLDTQRWLVLPLEPGEGYAGAAVTESGALSVTYCNYRH